MVQALTTTSYAILGHLAMQPWTAYELAGQMRRNLHYFFPRVESQLYAQPKLLVEQGLATLTTEATGRRRRTIYSITPKGRKALAAWLASPIEKGVNVEFEGLLRVILAPFGSDADLAATFVQIREDIGRMLDVAEGISDEYADGRAPLIRYAQYRSFMHDFLFHFAQLVDDWVVRSQERMAEWPEQDAETRRREGVAVYDRYRPAVRRRPRTGLDL